MSRLFLIHLCFGVTLIGCSSNGSCDTSERRYTNQLGFYHRELDDTLDMTSDAASLVNFAATYITDSLDDEKSCYMYNISATMESSIIELYDKRIEYVEQDEFSDSTYYVLTHIVDLHFNDEGVYQDSWWVGRVN